MDLVGTFVREIIAILGYVLVFSGVYKLFQIATDLREIKESLKSSQRSASLGAIPELGEANSYAEQLLRAVNAESYPATPPATPVATPVASAALDHSEKPLADS